MKSLEGMSPGKAALRQGKWLLENGIVWNIKKKNISVPNAKMNLGLCYFISDCNNISHHQLTFLPIFSKVCKSMQWNVQGLEESDHKFTNTVSTALDPSVHH